MKLFTKKGDLPEEVQKRVPPGQYLTEKWPVLHYGPVPSFDPKRWDFRVWGRVENELRWSWEEFQKLEQRLVQADMHCVTTWSRLDQKWEGIPFSKVLELAKPLPDAKFVISHCEHGFTANVPIEAVRDDDVLIALRANGEPLTPEHGSPARLVVPKLYAWKSAKWLRGIELSTDDKPGFWERNGYHNTGDPWKEQRYWGD
ncbi:MAG: sulfite oxidase-like oxidoreductase [Chloroflexota bacterium]|nr:sulfite oxidase-like oxidoreductase [Chloroflexota bacterium]MDE3193021.1 sulfite oxidase-like oxidoreductase [Chloroflexota bacterium]